MVENLLSTQTNTQTSTRGLTFILVFVALFSGYLLLRSAAGQTGTQLQSAAESAISILTVTVGVLAMVRLYRLLTELEQAKMAAEAANRSRSQALAITSHEIRTPMQVIMGMTELALRTELSDEPRQYLEAMQTSSEILLRVVNDILDFSKMEAGRLDLKPVTLHLRDTVERATRPLLVRAHQAGLGLAYDIDADVPDNLVGDRDRLRQVLLNLIDNALKFTRRGNVMLRVQTDSRTGQEVVLHYAVTDTGIGIPASKQDMIFEPFTQGDDAVPQSHGSAGLGLAICNHLVRMMGGRIWVDSQPDRGSTFHFTARFKDIDGWS